MKITYANSKVEKYFTDFTKMKRKLPAEWVRTIKKHINHLEAADNFGIFLSLGLGHPEQLTGYKTPTYSLRVSPNARMIVEVKSDQAEITICSEVEVEGVCDYHGDKENWYIP
ncbi:MAG: hypothetical protein ACI4KB_00680 [Oscillospiraceae bacterium]